MRRGHDAVKVAGTTVIVVTALAGGLDVSLPRQWLWNVVLRVTLGMRPLSGAVKVWSFKVFLMNPRSIEMTAAGFGHLTPVPFIMDSDWVYHAEASRYLRERAAGIVKEGDSRSRRPTVKSLNGFGRAIVNFLEWCGAKSGRSWHTLQYNENLLDEYQREMQLGLWSARGQPLAPTTINLRVGEATMFLTWAAKLDLRGPFSVPMYRRAAKIPNPRNTWGHQSRIIEVRTGKVRLEPALLRMPTDAEIDVWRRSVSALRGPTKALMIDLILQAAIRRTECVEWQIDTLPLRRSDWVVKGDFVIVTIRFGTKGGPKTVYANGCVAGPPRAIQLPLALAERLHAYREFRRKRNRAILIRSADSPVERRRVQNRAEPRLFLSDSTGSPVKGEGLYEAWTCSPRLPFKGWSPHGGRHWWVCKTLISAINGEITALQSQGHARSLNWLRGAASDALLMRVTPQLGHQDTRTTQMYLAWVMQMYGKGILDQDYQSALDDLPEHAA